MLARAIESILFASAKPVSRAKLSKILACDADSLEEAIVQLKALRNTDISGIQLMDHENTLHLVTHPEESEHVAVFLNTDLSDELTRPSVETLTIIAYRGPVTKSDIERIRGVNCTLILRNLLMRGLIEERMDTHRLQEVYCVSVDFLSHVGLTDIGELPDYSTLHQGDQFDTV